MGKKLNERIDHYLVVKKVRARGDYDKYTKWHKDEQAVLKDVTTLSETESVLRIIWVDDEGHTCQVEPRFIEGRLRLYHLNSEGTEE